MGAKILCSSGLILLFEFAVFAGASARSFEVPRVRMTFCHSYTTKKEATMSLWLLILIIVLVVLALGGVGYGRR